MADDIIQKCCICEADFRPGSLDKHGKCPSCRVEFPNVKNKMEAMALNQPNINLGKKIDEATVRQIIKEELNEFKAILKAEAISQKKADAMAHARAAKGQGNEQDETNSGDDK